MNLTQTARLAGVFYLLLIPLGILGIIYVPTTLIVAENSRQTIENIIQHETLFRWSIVSALVVQLINVALVFLLFKLFKNINKTLAYLMVTFSFLGVFIAFFNEINNLTVLHLLPQGNENQELISLFLNIHQQGIILAQVFWGLWLFPLGLLIYKSNFFPKLLGILLMLGCIGYVMDSFLFIIVPNIGITVSEFTFIGEVLSPLWLVIRGVKAKNI
ncbi:MAG: DUF4386 domain-containing protein [Flavobacteriales bacterium]|nr:DUF4386 domain-containing protein [Flavobacteriales bacterium]